MHICLIFSAAVYSCVYMAPCYFSPSNKHQLFSFSPSLSISLFLGNFLYFKLFHFGQPEHISFLLLLEICSNYGQEELPVFPHYELCQTEISWSSALSALLWSLCFFFREETRFGSLPISIPSFCESTGYYDCQSFSNIKAHLKRLNANLISYMKQS